MKFLIKLQREGWYFSGFKGSSGKTEIGRIQNAKIYSSRKEAMSEITRMGDCGQRIIAITKIGCAQKPQRPVSGKASKKLN
ncbi:hypothetical protein LZ575_06315 [Antarcticibacterium sp. 1MA-6-2]|uniref:hypothetical protein n=1 Tax=Antarcticibacterium sp. 1MA-6-2 TaxID=2908210 RepID=UPI001F420746|nr:hypothetical protein [Antarcticibacterium sp. 1MA-6-2]UJH92186.1 hypothetical protein LZ575_06315 [Antarcticibacterium sp. 1MA-6-2]